MSNRYYQDELRFLREVGPEFARANPAIARFLSDPGSDPDVERLLEGVAFLCGRIRQKLDDELPEFTANLMSLLWPHYLRPIPSISILEFLPDLAAMQAVLRVPTSAQFASVPVEGTRCLYRSCWPTPVRPLVMSDARLETASAQPVRLVFTVRASGRAKLDKLDMGSVRLHLTDLRDPRGAYALYLLLTAHVESVSARSADAGPSRESHVLPPQCIRPAGLNLDEQVIPYPPHSFAGYRLLQEYFVFRQRFLFVDLLHLDQAVARLGLKDSIEVCVTFNRRLEILPQVSAENVRLHCVPIINLFSHSADPIRLNHERVQYLVQPAKAGLADRRHAEVYAVGKVSGVSRSDTFELREYSPFYQFRHMGQGGADAGGYYQVHLGPNVVGGDLRLGTDTYLNVVKPASQLTAGRDETISLELLCMNRQLPASLRANDISEPTDSSPSGVRFRNIGKPTAGIAPPLGDSLQWRLIGHMSLNYLSCARIENLKQLLHLYDFGAQHDAQLAAAHAHLIEGVRNVECVFQERIIRGAPVRGMSLLLELHEDHFAGEGEAYLFGLVLDRFFALYVTLNGFVQTTIRLSKSGFTHKFPPRWGEQLTPVEGGQASRE